MGEGALGAGPPLWGAARCIASSRSRSFFSRADSRGSMKRLSSRARSIFFRADSREEFGDADEEEEDEDDEEDDEAEEEA